MPSFQCSLGPSLWARAAILLVQSLTFAVNPVDLIGCGRHQFAKFLLAIFGDGGGVLVDGLLYKLSETVDAFLQLSVVGNSGRVIDYL